MNPAQLLNPKAYAKEQAKSKKKAPNYGPQQTRKGAASPQQIQQPSYDPKALLNPKAAAGASKQKPENENSDHTSHQNGFGSMIEKLNGVQEREDFPTTKRKAQAVEEDGSDEERKKQKGNSFHQSAGGTLSEHMKEERMKMAPQADTIDLTNDDEGDDLQIIKVNDKQEVCLGYLPSKANMHRMPSSGTVSKETWPAFKAKLKPTHANIIELKDRQNTTFGFIEPHTAAAMIQIMNGALHNKARFSVLVPMRTKKPGEYVGQQVSKTLDLRIFLYAPRNIAPRLGIFLSHKGLFLQDPPPTDTVRTEVFNPQNAKPVYGPAKTAPNKPQHPSASVQRTAEEIRRETSNMFDNLAKPEDLPQMEANSDVISSELMSHQKQALHFMMDHERNDFDELEMSPHSLWKYRPKNNGQNAWYNIITGNEVLEKPHQIQGGILADVMGLGKTLSILSLIAETKDTARRFRRDGDVPEDGETEDNAAATLIICPKSVLANWQEQIRNHTAKDKIKVYTYHGTTRTQNLEHLAKHQVVLTSYNTVANEFGPGTRKNRALFKLNWFRIVLDEAHSIRNQSTLMSKACCALNAERRWAVTGTPVQNTLSDLGALIKFIRLKPFDESLNWSQYIMSPFKMGDADVIQKLQILVGSVTLRRMKTTIKLPNREEVRERLIFSSSEMMLYKQFATKSRSKFQQVTDGGNRLRGKAYAHVLKSLSRLRAICAHGREMLTDEDMKEIEGDDESNAIVLDIGDETEKPEDFITERSAYDTFYTAQESDADTCKACGNRLTADGVRPDGTLDLDFEDEADSDDDSEADNDLIGHLTPCYHLICTKCTEKHTDEMKMLMAPDRYFTCPYCSQYQRFGMYPIRHRILQQFKEEREGKKKTKAVRWDENTYSGPHTKVKALLEDLRKSAEETQQLPEGEPPIRSVVFSGWTAYLDLIEHALVRNDIGFARIDGSMSVKERSQNLQAFNKLPQITVLLVSIKAGGQGLNFTAANKAYVMEPQFNPGVEQQAVDRIHRIGQTRPVIIKHYIMQDSVEEGILKLQEKKEKLAKLSMEKKRSKAEEDQARMKELHDLFK